MKYWRKRKHDPAAKWELTTRKEMRAACAPYWADPVNMIQQTPSALDRSGFVRVMRRRSEREAVCWPCLRRAG
jgi:hypothetical protein